ncbi:hypothetical protein [Dokdonella sp.]|uniref:hypothetical protein n=1 Tax=Dokdonella sp. TaxID=2291710 RepID=UPI0025C5766E|nr:hypothetical protein [Dokdonella sp.]MBX3691263.1 hypothetical protein [Dokdonella sp.]
MHRPVATLAMSDEPVTPSPVRVSFVLAVLGWFALAAFALTRGHGVLAAVCAFLLVVLVLAPRLAAWRGFAWSTLAIVGSGLAALAWHGHGLLALEALPVAVSLGLAWLFGHTLVGARRPLIVRLIHVIEGEERLALPGVAAYARRLTLAWAALMLVQTLLFIGLLGVRHGLVGWPPRAFADTWLMVGGWLVPLAFMAGELAFRRWRLPHVPHDSPRVFLRRLVRNWPGLLRDTVR